MFPGSFHSDLEETSCEGLRLSCVLFSIDPMVHIGCMMHQICWRSSVDLLQIYTKHKRSDLAL